MRNQEVKRQDCCSDTVEASAANSGSRTLRPPLVLLSQYRAFCSYSSASQGKPTTTGLLSQFTWIKLTFQEEWSASNLGRLLLALFPAHEASFSSNSLFCAQRTQYSQDHWVFLKLSIFHTHSRPLQESGGATNVGLVGYHAPLVCLVL